MLHCQLHWFMWLPCAYAMTMMHWKETFCVRVCSFAMCIYGEHTDKTVKQEQKKNILALRLLSPSSTNKYQMRKDKHMCVCAFSKHCFYSLPNLGGIRLIWLKIFWRNICKKAFQWRPLFGDFDNINSVRVCVFECSTKLKKARSPWLPNSWMFKLITFFCSPKILSEKFFSKSNLRQINTFSSFCCNSFHFLWLFFTRFIFFYWSRFAKPS